MRTSIALLASTLLGFASLASAQTPVKPDVLVLTNGDRISGTLDSAAGGNVVFKSALTGPLTISFDKIKDLRSSGEFALLLKGVAPSATPAPEGTVWIGDGKVVVKPAAAPRVTVNSGDVAFLVSRAAYDKARAGHTGLLHGWNGAVTGGASFVRSTQDSTTFNVGINLVRDVPGVPYLPQRNRTLLGFTETYGKLSSPAIPETGTAASVVKTDLYHAGAERDEFLSPRLFALGLVTFDHNYSQGLQLQEIFGGGLGWAAIQQPVQELDLKATVQYEKQQFDTPSSNLNIFGSTFAETYRRNLPHKLVFTENGDFIPGWSDISAYSANVIAALAIPVYKRFGASLSTADNYLNNPSPGFNKNSYQFIAGVTYTLP